MNITTSYNGISLQQWESLVETSPVATWFQTPAAYDFFAANSAEMDAFVYAVTRSYSMSHENEGDRVVGIVVGYVTQEQSRIKQFFMRRAIIIGGPLLAEDITDEELSALLKAVRKDLKNKAIYIETRNFNSYERWKDVFKRCGFQYQPHLNFHVDTTDIEKAQSNIGKHRWKYIRLSIRDGAEFVENPSIEQVRDYYSILLELYKQKVRTPLYDWAFFEKLYYQKDAKFLLVAFEGKIVGGTVCMCLQNRVLYEWFVCGNDGFHKGIRPSSVATWFGIKYAAENGCKRFDFMGAGKPDEPYGVRDFKAEFGGKLVEYGRFLMICKPILYKIGCLGIRILKGK